MNATPQCARGQRIVQPLRDAIARAEGWCDWQVSGTVQNAGRHEMVGRGDMPIVDTSGAIVQLLAVSRDVSAPWQAEAFQAGQHQVLEMIATDAPLAQVLTLLVHLIEDQCEGMVCSVLLLDTDAVRVRLGAAPSLPDEYSRRVDGQPVGPRVGSCGTVMQVGRPVAVTDILGDSQWDVLRDVAIAPRRWSRSGLRRESRPAHAGLVSASYGLEPMLTPAQGRLKPHGFAPSRRDR